jgi:hypothetical protein
MGFNVEKNGIQSMKRILLVSFFLFLLCDIPLAHAFETTTVSTTCPCGTFQGDVDCDQVCGGNDNTSAYEAQEAQRRQEEARRQQQIAEEHKRKIEAEKKRLEKIRFEAEKKEALHDLKGVSAEEDDSDLKGVDSEDNDLGLKNSDSDEGKSSKKKRSAKDDGFHLKTSVDDVDDEGALKDSLRQGRPPKKEIKVIKKGCHCGGLGCHCLHDGLCGGTQACGCGGVDCGCEKPVCKFAGTYYQCDGTVQSEDDNGKKVQRCRATCKCHFATGCECSVSCNCEKRK